MLENRKQHPKLVESPPSIGLDQAKELATDYIRGHSSFGPGLHPCIEIDHLHVAVYHQNKKSRTGWVVEGREVLGNMTNFRRLFLVDPSDITDLNKKDLHLTIIQHKADLRPKRWNPPK